MHPPTLQFRIRGMDCAEEVAVLKQEIGPLVGGEEKLGFDVLNGKMTVVTDAPASPEAIQQAVARTEMRAEPWREESSAGGAAGRVAGTEYWVGSHRYLEERGQETPEVHERLEEMARAGRSGVVVGNDRHVCGFISLADKVRPESKQAVADLHAADIEHIVMLSGDNRGTAESIARETGIDAVYAELFPADKVTKVEELVSKYGSVAMAGDGVNDAPAMAQATIGIAMGAIGTDAAIETADIALMSDDLSKLPWLIRHARRALNVIRQNVAFSLGVKVVFVGLTFAGYASMWAAIAADTRTSLLVVFNGLRLLRPRPN